MNSKRIALPLAGAAVLAFSVPAQAQPDATASAGQLKKLSLEQLMDVEVTLVSRTPKRLSESAAAIQVITGEDIRRSGATSVPEALRLAPNLQVAQISSSEWIISARGFNTIFANKLLVMIDGRTVYSPLFGGVIWSQQNVLLEDVERIEVVSGPGATMWGVNAVNGVINIITKNTKDTKGFYIDAAGGSYLREAIGMRYGGSVGTRFNYRVYAQHAERAQLELPGGDKSGDATWYREQAGFRSDWAVNAKNNITLQGDFYWGDRKTKVDKSPFNGQNVLARWQHTRSDRSDYAVQFYFDRYFREDAPYSNSDQLHTWDVDFQFHQRLGQRHNFIAGAGYRAVRDFADFRTPYVGILPARKALDQANIFVQDEIDLTSHLKFTAGTKLSHNVYSGWELQPSARLAYNTERSTLWAAVSRAVRAPSRYDVDYFLPKAPQPPTVPSVAGGPNFRSEKVFAHELGYRLQPVTHAFFSVALFYNAYHDGYSVENVPGTLTYQIMNGSHGESWGLEFDGNWQPFSKLRLRGGYTLFDKNLRAKDGHNFNPDYLGNDVKHRAIFQSMLDLPLHLQLDLYARYYDGLPKTIATVAIPSYTTFDARLAYVYKGFELAVVGQNLGDKRHPEFGVLQVPRNYYIKASARF